MNRTRTAWLTGALTLAATTLPGTRSDAQSGQINSFAPTSTGAINFVVHDISTLQQTGSQSYSFTLDGRTGDLPGTITVTAPSIVGTGGNTIPAGAFSASCTATSDPLGWFSSTGTVRLGTSPVTCANLALRVQEVLQFQVTVFLDDTPDATAFTADTYATGTMSVTVNVP